MLDIRIDEVEALLVMLILDGRIVGALDGMHHVLQIKHASTPNHSQDMQHALHHWSKQVHALALAISVATVARLLQPRTPCVAPLISGQAGKAIV